MNRKITFIIYSLDCGGAERVVSLLANFFSSNNYVEIIVFSSNPPFYVLDKRIKISILKYKEFSNGFKIFNSLSRILSLRKLFLKRGDHVFISFTTTMNLLSLAANVFIRRRLIISERNDPKSPKISFFKKIGRYILYPFSDFLVVQNKIQYDFYTRRLFKSNTIEIPNPISPNLHKEFNDPDTHIVNVGRLVNQKNHLDLIDGFIESNIKCDLFIVGEGPLKNKIIKYIELRGFQNRIHLVGLVEDIYTILNNNWIFVSTSIYEGYPNALLEAMSSGLSCIHYNCPGISDIINDGENGVLVTLNDKNMLSKNIQKLYSDKKLREFLGTNAKKSVRKLSIDSIANSWHKLF